MGYHKTLITKGMMGESSKIKEEFEEFLDAVEQNDIILQLCELSDLYGAIESYLETMGLTMEDLKKFSDKTKQAFREGKR